MMDYQLHCNSNVSDDGLSASYTVLLTWLLNMVPNNFDYLQPSYKATEEEELFAPPFRVIGLQQLWLEEQHALVIAVTPPEGFGGKSPHGKKKSKVCLLTIQR